MKPICIFVVPAGPSAIHQCFTFASSGWGVVDDHEQVLSIGNYDEFLLLRPQPEQLQFVL